jgi:hypothetical protein
VFVRYPPGKIRYDGDRPVALLGVRVAPSFRLVDLPLGLPTTSARTERGPWALYPIGAEVVVVHPDGAVSGPPAAVATEVGRLAARDRQGDLDRQAAWTIQRLLTGDSPAHAGPGRLGARTWSIPAKAYWLSGPDNHHQQVVTGTADHPEPSHRAETATAIPPPLSPQHRARPAAREPAPIGHSATCIDPDTVAASPTSSGWPPEPAKEATHTMRIMAVCNNCQRDLLLSQLVEGPQITGRCPWCGTLLAPHYTLLLADAVRRAERAGTELVRALAQLGQGWATLQIRPESVLDPIRAPLTAEEPPSRPVLRQAA